MMLQMANHWTEHMNWSLPARRRVESRQYRRRTILNKGYAKGEVAPAAVTQEEEPMAVKSLLTQTRYWTHPVCSWYRTATGGRSLIAREYSTVADSAASPRNPAGRKGWSKLLGRGSSSHEVISYRE
jgi:hypothetical protein